MDQCCLDGDTHGIIEVGLRCAFYVDKIMGGLHVYGTATLYLKGN